MQFNIAAIGVLCIGDNVAAAGNVFTQHGNASGVLIGFGCGNIQRAAVGNIGTTA